MLRTVWNVQARTAARITRRGPHHVLDSSSRASLWGQQSARSWGGGQCKRSCVRCITTSVWLNDEKHAAENIQKMSSRFDNDQGRNGSFSRHWHFWNLMLSLTPAAITLYYLHFVVRKEMHETARRMKSKNSDVTQDNSIRGRRNAREGERQRQAATLNESILDDVQESNSELQRKIAALEKKLDEVVADLNNSVEKGGTNRGKEDDGGGQGKSK